MLYSMGQHKFNGENQIKTIHMNIHVSCVCVGCCGYWAHVGMCMCCDGVRVLAWHTLDSECGYFMGMTGEWDKGSFI